MEAEFEAVGIPHRERGARMNELLELITALWTQDHVTYEGRFYRVHDLSLDPKPAQRPHPPIWIGGGTQPSEKIYGQQVPTVEPVLRRIAKYAKTWVPHSSATAEMVDRDWDDLRRYMLEYGRQPEEMSRVYSNFVHVLRPGERPEDAAPLFRVYSGMDLDYWQRYYLLGEAEDVADRIRAKVAALGGVDHLVLNPLNWDPANLERLASGRPAEGGGLTVAAGVTSPLPPYLRPDRLDDALAILASEPRLVVAGGTDVYPAYAIPADRPARARHHGAARAARRGRRRATPGGSRPSTTWTDVAEAALPPELDGLRAAARTIGGRQIQNAGTVCGNVVNASPAADGLPNLLALDASVEVASADGERVVPIADFVLGQPPDGPAGRASWSRACGCRRSRARRGTARGRTGVARSTFLKLGSRAYLVISIVAVAAVLVVDRGVVVDARIAVGACSPVARRLRGLERELRGRRAGPSLATVPAMEHLSPLAPIDDVRGTADYRWDAALTLVRRAIAEVAA